MRKSIAAALRPLAEGDRRDGAASRASGALGVAASAEASKRHAVPGGKEGRCSRRRIAACGFDAMVNLARREAPAEKAEAERDAAPQATPPTKF